MFTHSKARTVTCGRYYIVLVKVHDRVETPLKSKVYLHEVISNNEILFSIKIYNRTYTNFTEFYKKSSTISTTF